MDVKLSLDQAIVRRAGLLQELDDLCKDAAKYADNATIYNDMAKMFARKKVEYDNVLSICFQVFEEKQPNQNDNIFDTMQDPPNSARNNNGQKISIDNEVQEDDQNRTDILSNVEQQSNDENKLRIHPSLKPRMALISGYLRQINPGTIPRDIIMLILDPEGKSLNIHLYRNNKRVTLSKRCQHIYGAALMDEVIDSGYHEIKLKIIKKVGNIKFGLWKYTKDKEAPINKYISRKYRDSKGVEDG
eukprot:375553_1